MPAVVRVGSDTHVGHASPTLNPFHKTAYASGSSNVFTNGKPTVRLGDSTGCGDPATSASTDVYVNSIGVHRKGDSTGGRPPKVIKFDGSHNYVIGIDLGATNIRAGLSDLEGLFINEIQTSTDIYGGIDKICEQIGELSEK